MFLSDIENLSPAEKVLECQKSFELLSILSKEVFQCRDLVVSLSNGVSRFDCFKTADFPVNELPHILREFQCAEKRIHSLCRMAWHSTFEIGECLVSFVASKLMGDDFISDVKELKLLAEKDLVEMDRMLSGVTESYRFFQLKNQ